MGISDEQLQSFRKIYFEHYGREISNEDAYVQAMKLIQMMKVIYKPMTDEEWETVRQTLEKRGIKIQPSTLQQQ